MQAPKPLPSNSFIKRHSLLDYGDTIASRNLSTLLLNEARICEVLRINPHPNIAEYKGCVVDDGKITGLCFARYEYTLSQRVKDRCLVNKVSCLQSIEEGIRHLHRLGLIHCDINPSNIFMDGEKPIIGDFDSCQWEGSELGLKAGTMGWMDHEFKEARRENDWYGLSKIREFIIIAQ
jgi:serine/threonine protein kinase